jgi:ATP-dependent Clp protease, protease subunit
MLENATPNARKNLKMGGNILNPDALNPDDGNPRAGNPRAGNPRAANPQLNLSASMYPNSGAMQPGMAGPGMAGPEFGGPDFGGPDFGGPDTGIMNSYSYQNVQRQRQLTLGDLLLENRIVFLQGEIYTGNANEVVMKLLYLQSENRRKDIHFYINSPGGDVSATLAVYDTMQILTCPVATYCVGQAASGGAVLLAGGSSGKRFALPHSRIMMHQPYGGVNGQVSDIEIQAKEIVRNREMLNEILAEHCGQSAEKIAEDTDRDFFMGAEEAKEYGVVDDILSRPPMSDSDDDDATGG